jgi:ATP-binding cassette subfamily B protein
MIDRVLVTRSAVADAATRVQWLGWYVLALVGVRMCTWGAEWVHAWMVAWLGARLTADLRSQLYQHLERLPLGFHDRYDVGSLTARVTTDTATLQDFLIRGLPYLLINGLTLIGILAMMLAISPRLTLWVVAPVPLLWAWAVVFWRRMNGLFYRWSDANARFAAQVTESVSGVREVKTFGRQAREAARFERLNRRVFHRTADTATNRVVLLATVGLVTGTGISLVWWFGGGQVLGGTLTVGALVAFYNYVLLFNTPLQWFGQFSDWSTRALTGALRIFEVLDLAGEDDGAPGPMPPERPHAIGFHDVTFGYDKIRPVLRGVTLHVSAGETIGIVGRSGVGKTTLMQLLCRFYDPDAGAIAIDGRDVGEISRTAWRRYLGIVPQQPVLFRGTIAENIAYGRPGIGLEQIVVAARLANAHRFILAKAEGYDTQVGEGGKALSLGERQRIAIARAVLRDAPILVLDEATSSVDALSEAAIHASLRRVAAGRTSFVIAHRLATLKTADRLVVLDDGQVRETGTYDELMGQRGAFHDLVHLQDEAGQEVEA